MHEDIAICVADIKLLSAQIQSRINRLAAVYPSSAALKRVARDIVSYQQTMEDEAIHGGLEFLAEMSKELEDA